MEQRHWSSGLQDSDGSVAIWKRTARVISIHDVIEAPCNYLLRINAEKIEVNM
jgi:hypothetical protein